MLPLILFPLLLLWHGFTWRYYQIHVHVYKTDVYVHHTSCSRSKVYIYMLDQLLSNDMVAKLNEFAATLGYGGAEIFPKQISRANERDRGNWINLCYWDGGWMG